MRSLTYAYKLAKAMNELRQFSARQLAEKTGIPTDVVHRHIARAQDAGFLRVQGITQKVAKRNRGPYPVCFCVSKNAE